MVFAPIVTKTIHGKEFLSFLILTKLKKILNINCHTFNSMAFFYFLFRRVTSKLDVGRLNPKFFQFFQIFLPKIFPRNFQLCLLHVRAKLLSLPQWSGRPCQIFIAAANELQLGLSNFYAAAKFYGAGKCSSCSFQNFPEIPNFSSSCAAGKLHKKSIVQLQKFWYFTIRKKS